MDRKVVATIRMPLWTHRGNDALNKQHVVEVEIDADALARRLAQKAAYSSRGYSQMAHGAVRVKVSVQK